MDGNASFGYWVRRRRRALDLTQDELARRVGCSVITIRKIEADARRPSTQVAERLADQLNIAPADRAAFIKVARATLSADRIAPAIRQADPLAGERPPQRDPPSLWRRGERAAVPKPVRAELVEALSFFLSRQRRKALRQAQGER